MSEIDYDRLAAHVRAKQRNRGLREVAAEIGDISASTLSRLLRNLVTDMSNSTYLQICDWLGVSPQEFVIEGKEHAVALPDISTPDKIALQLRADPDLDVQTASMISQMVKAAYEQVRQEKHEDTE